MEERAEAFKNEIPMAMKNLATTNARDATVSADTIVDNTRLLNR